MASPEERAMPLLVINMGGEMLYILEQRLRAQAIPEEKSLRVLRDVVGTMFSEKFIHELFKPQLMYSNTSTRQIFDRLAHSSIMRLNESSMDKLYDLMSMGFKYQVLSCSHPSDLLQITLNHLDALRNLVKNSTETVKLLEHTQKAFVDTYKDMSTANLTVLRQTLCRFFQERKVKVSLFLQDQIQSLDGAIVINPEGPAPPGSEVPGTVRYFGDDGKVASEEKLPVRNAQNISAPPPAEWDLLKSLRTCKLGLNLYAKDRKKSGSKTAAAKTPVKAGAAAATTPASPPEAKQPFDVSESSKQAAKKELNMLASLIGGTAAKETDKFNVLSLFPDTQLTPSTTGPTTRTAEVITFDVEDSASLRDVLSKEFDVSGAPPKHDNELLDLLDSAQ